MPPSKREQHYGVGSQEVEGGEMQVPGAGLVSHPLIDGKAAALCPTFFLSFGS